ncbi:MAG: hypothetical protein ACJAVZ_003619 [Afipia broomeae]|jgi:hypothetical protein
MIIAVQRAAENAFVVNVEHSGKAGKQPKEGKIKSRTSRLGRSVVMICLFPISRTSRSTGARCASCLYRAISTNTAHRDGYTHGSR